MAKHKTKEDPDLKEYVALTINRSEIRDRFGDKIADQMTDEKMQKFAGGFGDYIGADDDLWRYGVETVLGIELSDDTDD